jgi:hypothetical protein
MNPTVTLTLILLSLMIASGVISAAWGYALGREALKGITQPDTRPGSPLVDSEAIPPRREEVTLLKEEEILQDIESRIEGRASE